MIPKVGARNINPKKKYCRIKGKHLLINAKTHIFHLERLTISEAHNL